MSFRLGALVVASLGLAMPAGGAASTCGAPRHADVLDRSGASVIYATKLKVYGCRRGSKRVTLAEILPDTREQLGSVNGRYAAVVQRRLSHYGCEDVHVKSFDLERRRPVVEASLGRTNCVEDVPAYRLDALLVGQRGSIAAMMSNRGAQEVVRVRRGATAAVVLDRGTEITAWSLRLRGTTLAWRNASERRTATLR